MNDALNVMISQIDAKLKKLEAHLVDIKAKFNDLQTTRRTLLEEFGESPVDESSSIPHWMRPTYTPPADDSLSNGVKMPPSRFHLTIDELSPEKVRRKDQIILFLLKQGPHSRKAISDLTNIPEGTIAFEMRDRNVFAQLDDGRWDLTEDHKRLMMRSTEEEHSDVPY